jgi:hypothetical protein
VAQADRVTPQTIKKKIRRRRRPAAPKKAAPKKKYTLPSNFRTEAAADKPKKIKAGPPSPQITGRPSRPQPKRAPVRDRLTRKDIQRGKTYVASQYAAEPDAAKKYFFDRKTGKYTRKSPYGDTVPPDVARRQSYKDQQLKNLSADVARAAPALKVLEQTTRPLHGVAAGTRAAIKGQNVPKAIGRGLANKDKSTFSDVLKDVGAPKIVRSVGGFALDVAADPTTYVTGGTASITRKAAVKAAKDAEKKALAQGLTNEQAARFGERAQRKTEKTGDQSKGATVKFAGREVPGVTKATAKAAKPVKAAARKTTPTKLRARARSVGADVSPNVAPVGVAKETSRKAISATRTARAKRDQGIRRAAQVGHGIRTQIGEENYNAVVDAIEAGKIGKLPEHLRRHAVTLRSQSRHIRRVQRRAGVKVADLSKSKGPVKGYVYRQLTEEAAAADAKKAAARGTVTKPISSKARKEKRPLAEIRKAQPGRYREDLHSLTAERLTQGTTSAAKAELFHRLADLGRAVKRGKPPVLADGEAVFHIKAGQAPREVTDETELARATAPLKLNKSGSKVKNATPKSVGAGQYVVLNRDVVKRAVEGAAPTMQGPGIVHEIDKITGGFKRLAIGTIGFHVRNFIGDTNQAYVGQAGHRLPGNMRRAAKTLKAAGRQDKATRDLVEMVPEKGTLKTGKYGEVTYDEVARRLFQHGAARSGYVGRELPELSKSGGVKAGGRVRKTARKAGQTRAGQAAKRFVLNREDLPRLTTAIDALRRGATWEQAAQRVADIHFDYGHLTNFERQIARRAMPFYTWSARNIPFQAKHVVLKPGKYANYQKVREEATKASGADQQTQQTRDLYAQLEKAGVKLPQGWEKSLSQWEQRNAGIPFSIGGKKFTESFGLPLADLNEFPGAALNHQLDEWFQKGMSLTGPIPKNIIEYFDNHSFFFRDQLERDNSPLVPAPAYASRLPGPIKKWAGVTDQLIDKKTGKKVLGWKGKADYVFKSVPGTPNYLQQFATQGADRRGKGTVGKVLAFSGVKSVPIDPIRNAVDLAYARMQEIQKRQAELRQQGINAKNPTPEYTRLLAQLKIVNQIAFQGKSAQGYKVLPKQGGPPKIRSLRVSTGGGSTDVFGRSSSRASSGSGGTDVFGRSR